MKKNLLILLDKFYDILITGVPKNENLILHWSRFKELLEEEPLNYQKIYSYIAKMNSENLSMNKPPISTSQQTLQRDPALSVLPEQSDKATKINSRRNSMGFAPSIEEMKFDQTVQTTGDSNTSRNTTFSIPDHSYLHYKANDISPSSTQSNSDLHVLSSTQSAKQEVSKHRPTPSVPRINILPPTNVRNSGMQARLNTRLESEVSNDPSPSSAISKKESSQSDRLQSIPTQTGITSRGSYKVIPALEYISKLLRKPYFTISNYAVYYNHYVVKISETSNSLYQAVSLVFMMCLLSDKYPERLFEEIVEKLLTRKIKLSSYFSNEEQAFQCLCSHMNNLLSEKRQFTETRDYSAVQERFLEKFFNDLLFKESLTALMKELAVEYLCSLDAGTFGELFPNEKSASRLLSDIKNSNLDPTEDIVSILPHIIDACLEVHYVEENKIDIVLYGQRSEKSLFETRCPQASSFTIVCAQQANRKFFYITFPGEEMHVFGKLAEEPFYIDNSKLNFHKENPNSKKIIQNMATCSPTENQVDEDPFVKNMLMTSSTVSTSRNFGELNKECIPTEESPPKTAEDQEPKFDAQKFKEQALKLMKNFEDHSEKLYVFAKKSPKNTENEKDTRSKENGSILRGGEKHHTRILFNPIPHHNSILAKIDSNANAKNYNIVVNTPGLDATKKSQSEKNVFKPNGPTTNIFRTQSNPSEENRRYSIAKDPEHEITSAELFKPRGQKGNAGNCPSTVANHFLSPYYAHKTKFESPTRREIRELAEPSTRSPLKRIDIYTNQPKESAFALIEKEATLIYAMDRKSPRSSPSTNRLILDENY